MQTPAHRKHFQQMDEQYEAIFSGYLLGFEDESLGQPSPVVPQDTHGNEEMREIPVTYGDEHVS